MSENRSGHILDEKFVPVVKSLSIDFNQPALTDATSEAFTVDNNTIKLMGGLG